MVSLIMYSKTEINATAIRAVLYELSKQATWGPLAKGEKLNNKLNALAKKHAEVFHYFKKVDDPRYPGVYTPHDQPEIFKFVDNTEISEDKLHNFIIDFSNALLDTKNKENILMYILFSNKYCLNPIFKNEAFSSLNYMKLSEAQNNENIQILNSIKKFSEDQLSQRKEQSSNTNIFFSKNITNTTNPDTQQQAQIQPQMQANPYIQQIQQQAMQLGLDEHKLKAIIESPQCVQAIQNGDISLESLVAVDLHKLREITKPECIQAIQDNQTTVEQLAELDLYDLRETVTNGNYTKGAGLN